MGGYLPSRRNCALFAHSPLPATEAASPTLQDPIPIPHLCLPLRCNQTAQQVGDWGKAYRSIFVWEKGGVLLLWGCIIIRGGDGGSKERSQSPSFPPQNLLQALNSFPLSIPPKLSESPNWSHCQGRDHRVAVAGKSLPCPIYSLSRKLSSASSKSPSLAFTVRKHALHFNLAYPWASFGIISPSTVININVAVLEFLVGKNSRKTCLIKKMFSKTSSS